MNPVKRLVSPKINQFPVFVYLKLFTGIALYLLAHEPTTMKLATSKFGIQLRFAKTHLKNHTQREKWAWPWLRELPNILAFPCIICATAEASDFKFGLLLGFAKSCHKITATRSRLVPRLGELPNILTFS